MSNKATRDSYSEQARKYEKKWEKYLEHTHSVVLNDLNLKPDAEILDVSAGTGLFQQRMVEQNISFKKMVLNDPSKGMLDVAESRFTADSRFSFTRQKTEDLRFPDQTFDVILSLNAFHNYQQQEEVVKEWYRVLRPGGSLYLLDWNNSGMFKMVNTVIDVCTREVIQTRSADEVRQMLRDCWLDVGQEWSWWYTWWKFYYFHVQKN